MKHPVTQLMTAMMGSANSMTLHRAVIRALRDAGSPNPLESAAILEHLIYLQAEQGEWVVFPVEEAPDTVFTPERTFKRHTAWLRSAGLIDCKRTISAYKGQSGNFQHYRPCLGKLSELMGCGPFESAFLAPSKLREVARSSSISREKKEVPRNHHFDALMEGLYPGRAEVANSKRVGAVAAELKRAGWTPELITTVLSAVLRREKWWKEHGITPDAFLKNCETWRTKYARDSVAVRPPVTTGETTPADDLDWTAMG